MKHQEYSLQDILKDFSSQNHLKDKLLDKKLEEIWKTLYEKIATYTTKVHFKNGKLTVWISSAPLRQELMYNKEKIVLQLNKSLNKEMIEQIDFR